jgi:hypothetical protein
MSSYRVVDGGSGLKRNRRSVSNVDACDPRAGNLCLVRKQGCGLDLKQADVWSYGNFQNPVIATITERSAASSNIYWLVLRLQVISPCSTGIPMQLFQVWQGSRQETWAGGAK